MLALSLFSLALAHLHEFCKLGKPLLLCLQLIPCDLLAKERHLCWLMLENGFLVIRKFVHHFLC